MKKLFIVLLVLTAFLLNSDYVKVSDVQADQLFNVKSSNLSTTVFDFTLDGYKSEKVFENGTEYLKITYWNEGEYADVGKPDLPCFTRLIAIPDAGEVTVSVNSISEEVIDDVTVYPRQRLMSDSEPIDRSFVIDENYYRNGEIFPNRTVEAGKPAVMRDLRVVPVTINPFRYNPQTKELRIIKNMEISVNCNGSGGENPKFVHHKLSRSFEPLYRSVVINYDATLSRDEEYQTPNYLFIYPDDVQVQNALQELIDWKHQKGFSVTAASTAETGSSVTSIKNYLQNAYDTWETPPEYVCLVGDAGGSFNIPTSSMDGGEGDQYYALLDGNDVLADVIIGRFSFNSLFELNTIIYKVLYYEKEPYMDNTDWYTHSLLVGDPSSSGQSTIITKKNIKELMLHNEENYTFDEVYSGNFPSSINNSLDGGAAFFNYRGYIGMSGWDTGNMDALNNGFMLPFAGILTCGTGGFSGTWDCRSEYFVKVGAPGSPKGAIAAVGTATASTHTCFNNCVDAGMFYGIFVDKINEPGAALVRGKLNLYLNYPQNPNNSVYKFSYWNNLMGDPGIELWTNVPQTMLVTYNPQVALGTNYFTVSVEKTNHQPIAGAWVNLLKGNDEIFVSGYTDENGDITLPINTETEGGVSVTVTQKNYIPYLGNFTIGQADVFVDVSDVIVEDGSGNNDGNLNPGETAGLQIALKNYGTTDADAVSATISSNSSLITITEATESYGSIPAGNTVNPDNDFQVSINPAALGGAEIVLDIDITDNAENNWTDKIYLTVVGANLSENGYTIVDGNNSTFDPGETVEMKITLVNLGSFPAANVYATLSCDNNDITINDAEGFFGNIAAGGSAENNSDTFSLTSSTTIIPGTQVPLTMEIHNADGYDDIAVFNIEVGTVSVNDPLGPDAYGYYCYDDGDSQFINAPVYGWIEIDPTYGGNGNTLSMNDGGNTGALQTIDIPFYFKFYGESYSQITICSNGWIAPGITEQHSFMNWHIPGPIGPSPMIAPFWDDLTTSGGHVCYKYEADSHYLVVEWSHLSNEYNGAEETFQAVLYDANFYPTSTGDSEIMFQYKTINNVDQGDYTAYHVQHGQYATVGLEDHTGLIGLEYTFNNTYPTAAKPLQNEMAILFTGPPIPHEEPFLILGGVTIDDENGNGNGNADFGENIDLYVALNNLGENTATGLSAVISSNDEYITLNGNSSDYDDIDGGTSQNNLTPFNFSVADNAPDGHAASFQIDVTGNEDTWTVMLQVILNAPNVEVQELTIANDLNSNGILDPGETADLIFYLHNSGGADALNLNAELSTSDNYITINSSTGNISNLEADATGFVTFNVTAAPQSEIGHTVSFQISVNANGNYNAVDLFYVTIGLSIEDFETGNFDRYPWTFGGNAPWEITSNNVYEGSYSAQSQDIGDGQNSLMQVELHVLSAGQISFWKKVSSENGWDFLRFYIDGNELENWTGEVSWSESSYNVTVGTHTFSWNYTKDGSVSNGSDCAWIDYIIFPPVSISNPPVFQIDPLSVNVTLPVNSTSVDSLILSNTGGGVISYNLEIDEHNGWVSLESDAGVLVAGDSNPVFLDFNANNLNIGEYNCNLVITDNLRNETIIPITMNVTAVNVDNETVPQVTKLGLNYPNPFILSGHNRNAKVNLRYQLAENSKVTLDIYNIRGQNVKTLLNASVDAGYHSVYWDGKDEYGKPVSSGIYFYKMNAGDYSKIRKMMIIR